MPCSSRQTVARDQVEETKSELAMLKTQYAPFSGPVMQSRTLFQQFTMGFSRVTDHAHTRSHPPRLPRPNCFPASSSETKTQLAFQPRTNASYILQHPPRAPTSLSFLMRPPPSPTLSPAAESQTEITSAPIQPFPGQGPPPTTNTTHALSVNPCAAAADGTPPPADSAPEASIMACLWASRSKL